MKKPKRLVCAGLIAILLPGCAQLQTIAEQNPLLATAGCGALGAIIAVGTGSEWAGGGTATACAALALTVYATRTHSAAEDRALYERADPELYGLKPGEPARVKLRSRTSTPREAQRGSKVTAETGYSLVAPDANQSIEVVSNWTLKKDNKQLFKIDGKPERQQAGTFRAVSEFDVPKDAEAGTYIVEHRVQAGTSYDLDQSFFVVSATPGPQG